MKRNGIANQMQLKWKTRSQKVGHSVDLRSSLNFVLDCRQSKKEQWGQSRYQMLVFMSIQNVLLEIKFELKKTFYST